MIKLLIITCCEVIMGNGGNISYSYEVGYVDDAKNYTITLYTTRKYEVGDEVGFFEDYIKIGLSDTIKLYNNNQKKIN
tara:strand:+ start:260 stop:493 length:234 start_codon:yes stop_codon:yes gene_type:complete